MLVKVVTDLKIFLNTGDMMYRLCVKLLEVHLDGLCCWLFRWQNKLFKEIEATVWIHQKKKTPDKIDLGYITIKRYTFAIKHAILHTA